MSRRQTRRGRDAAAEDPNIDPTPLPERVPEDPRPIRCARSGRIPARKIADRPYDRVTVPSHTEPADGTSPVPSRPSPTAHRHNIRCTFAPPHVRARAANWGSGRLGPSDQQMPHPNGVIRAGIEESRPDGPDAVVPGRMSLRVAAGPDEAHATEHDRASDDGEQDDENPVQRA